MLVKRSLTVVKLCLTRDVLIGVCEGLLFAAFLYGAAFLYCVLP